MNLLTRSLDMESQTPAPETLQAAS